MNGQVIFFFWWINGQVICISNWQIFVCDLWNRVCKFVQYLNGKMMNKKCKRKAQRECIEETAISKEVGGIGGDETCMASSPTRASSSSTSLLIFSLFSLLPSYFSLPPITNSQWVPHFSLPFSLTTISFFLYSWLQPWRSQRKKLLYPSTVSLTMKCLTNPKSLWWVAATGAVWLPSSLLLTPSGSHPFTVFNFPFSFLHDTITLIVWFLRKPQ